MEKIKSENKRKESEKRRPVRQKDSRGPVDCTKVVIGSVRKGTKICPSGRVGPREFVPIDTNEELTIDAIKVACM